LAGGPLKITEKKIFRVEQLIMSGGWAGKISDFLPPVRPLLDQAAGLTDGRLCRANWFGSKFQASGI
jgi:hypothetical protein